MILSAHWRHKHMFAQIGIYRNKLRADSQPLHKRFSHFEPHIFASTARSVAQTKYDLTIRFADGVSISLYILWTRIAGVSISISTRSSSAYTVNCQKSNHGKTAVLRERKTIPTVSASNELFFVIFYIYIFCLGRCGYVSLVYVSTRLPNWIVCVYVLPKLRSLWPMRWVMTASTVEHEFGEEKIFLVHTHTHDNVQCRLSSNRTTNVYWINRPHWTSPAPALSPHVLIYFIFRKKSWFDIEIAVSDTGEC